MGPLLKRAVFCFAVLFIDSTFCATVTAPERLGKNEEKKFHYAVPCNREFCRDEDNQMCTDEGCVCKDGYAMDPREGYICVEESFCRFHGCDDITTVCNEERKACECRVGYIVDPFDPKKCEEKDFCSYAECDPETTNCNNITEKCDCKEGFVKEPGNETACRTHTVKNCKYDYECAANEGCRYEICQCWPNFYRRENGECTENGCPFEMDCNSETEDCIDGKCECKNGFVPNNYGDCVDVCMFHRCLNGTCERRVNYWVCKCDDGFSGRFCDINITIFNAYKHESFFPTTVF